MRYNRHNYESAFVDYSEGKLSAEEVAELLVFIEGNPDLKAEFEMFSEAPIALVNEAVFENKSDLKKIDVSRFNDLCIGEVEQTNNFSEKNELNEFLKIKPGLNRDTKLFSLTKLPQEQIIFEDKDSLKHESKVRPLFYYLAAAASVLLLIGIGYTFMINEKVPNTNSVVVNEEKKNKEEKTPSVDKEIIPTNLVANNDPKKVNKRKTVKAKRSVVVKEDANIVKTETLEEVKTQEYLIAMVPEPVKENIKPVIEQEPIIVLKEIRADKIEISPVESKSKWQTLAQTAFDKLKRLTGNQAEIVYNKKDCETLYKVKIGGVEFERTVACK